MPRYEFPCQKCNESFELIMSISEREKAKIKCPTCWGTRVAASARFNIDPRRDLNYVQLGDTGQGIAALQAGAIDALTTTPPHNLFAQRLGYKVILDRARNASGGVNC
jgi:putative FmdB family regulatory protein